MRFWMVFALTAASVVPGMALHALEAVAQQPYYQSAGKNLTASLKVDAVGNRVVHLSETITQIIDCNSQGKLWDGAGCVAPGGITIPNCGTHEVLKGVGGSLVCVAAPAGANGVDGKDAAVPACTPSQTVVVKDGVLACLDKEILSVKLYRCPVAEDVSQGGSAECLSHCNGQITTEPTCSYSFDDRKGPGWACYGRTTLNCTPMQ